MDRNFEIGLSGEIPEVAQGFRAPAEFSHTGTEMAQTFVGSFTGAPRLAEVEIEEVTEVVLIVSPSYMGVQNPAIIRNEQGWPLTRSGNQQLTLEL